MFFVDIHSDSGYLLSARYVTVTILDTKGILAFCIFYFVTFLLFGHFSTEAFVFLLLICENFLRTDGINSVTHIAKF